MGDAGDGSRKDQDGQPPAIRGSQGVILDHDGKPCRACNTFASFASHSKAALVNSHPTKTPAQQQRQQQQPPSDCPADVEVLGRSTWTLLHTMAASYPESPSPSQQSDISSFIRLFARLYPCWVCATDFQTYIDRASPRVESRADFGTWLCDAHNDVNRKLGKPEFDCKKWEERWRTGPKDGRCG